MHLACRSLTERFFSILRPYSGIYMWDFVQANWDAFQDAPDRTALAYLLARRLAISLSGTWDPTTGTRSG